ncbi:MAG: 4Fe-4S binding protein [Eubacterium sp.]|nr:4Fe-4S binding protein [Eubacterium sp.]
MKKATPKKELCVSCGACVKQCPREAIHIKNGCYAKVDLLKCVGCGLCAKACPANAIFISEEVAYGVC